jgi:hypothetical protein
VLPHEGAEHAYLCAPVTLRHGYLLKRYAAESMELQSQARSQALDGSQW